MEAGSFILNCNPIVLGWAWVARPESAKGVVHRNLATPIEDSGRATRKHADYRV